MPERAPLPRRRRSRRAGPSCPRRSPCRCPGTSAARCRPRCRRSSAGRGRRSGRSRTPRDHRGWRAVGEMPRAQQMERRRGTPGTPAWSAPPVQMALILPGRRRRARDTPSIVELAPWRRVRPEREHRRIGGTAPRKGRGIGRVHRGIIPSAGCGGRNASRLTTCGFFGSVSGFLSGPGNLRLSGGVLRRGGVPPPAFDRRAEAQAEAAHADRRSR